MRSALCDSLSAEEVDHARTYVLHVIREVVVDAVREENRHGLVENGPILLVSRVELPVPSSRGKLPLARDNLILDIFGAPRTVAGAALEQVMSCF